MKRMQRSVEQLADESGLQIKQWVFDSREWFSLAELTLKGS